MVVITEIVRKTYQRAFMDSSARFPAFIAGWGTGKTLCGIGKGLRACEQPDNLGLIVRKEFTDLKDSTMKDFETYTGIKIGSDKNVKVFGSEIMFRHGAELAVLQNINLGWFLIEQADEFETADSFQMLRGRLRRKNVKGHFGAVIANTKGHNWLWRLWKRKEMDEKPTDEQIEEIISDSGIAREDVLAAFDPGHYPLFEATTYDNKDNLPAEFILDLVRMKKESPSHYNRFVMNSWEDLDVEDKVIPYSAILKAVNNKVIHLRDKKVVACDPAEFGQDETVIYGIKNGKIIERDIFFRKELYETAHRIMDIAYKMNCTNIVIDPIGIGAGVRSHLAQRALTEKITIFLADGRERARDEKTYFNKRAEMWFAARQRFIDGTVCIPDDDDQLQEELSKVGYEIQADKTRRIHSKEKIRKEDYLGHSPSRAECLVYGLWAEGQVEYDDEKQGIEWEEGESALAGSYNIKSNL